MSATLTELPELPELSEGPVYIEHRAERKTSESKPATEQKKSFNRRLLLISVAHRCCRRRMVCLCPRRIQSHGEC